jgi:hemerythrin
MQEAHAWSERLDIGDEDLDREHHLQIALLSGLTDALEQGRPLIARRLAEQLCGYSAAHFSGEEVLMHATAYENSAAHRQEHQALLSQMQEIQSLVASGESDLALPMTLDLRGSLANHIAAFDRQFVRHGRAAATRS